MSSGMSAGRWRSGGGLQRKHVQAKIQVLPKFAAGHRLFQIAIGGGIVALGVGMGAQVLQLLGILQAEMQPRPGAVLLKAAVDLNPDIVLGGLQDECVAPGPALLDELLAEHDQRRQVGREQPAGC